MTEAPGAPGVESRAEYLDSERVIVLAPTRRDGEVTCKLLADVGVEVVVAGNWEQAAAFVQEGAGALTVTDITLADPDSAGLLQALEKQPAWSDLPVVALCRQGLQAPSLRGARLRNLTVLDRPASMRALVSAVMTALRGRRWQYQIRDQIESLLAAERALREADQRKDEFLATLAHELRNPLAPIRTGMQLLTKRPADTQHVVTITQMMERQMTQLLRLIDDLLEISRISTGKLMLQRERLDLRRVVEMALESCAPLLAKGGHRLTVSLPDHEVCVDGDLTRLAQALSNIVNNAAKYTPDGGLIEVVLARADHEAVLTVTDSGVGLPEDMISRVFDMFAQVNRSLDRAQGGLGIGLALVRSLVLMHGGTVSAASPGVGQGSTFTIRLPVAQQDTAPDADGTAPATAAAHALRILVVDDNEDAASTLAMLLSLNGHDVKVEHGGHAGLATTAEFMPQAIFCDVGMPGLDGYEFARRVRQDSRFATTLLVALTGWGSEEDKKRSRAAGFDEHLTKPASEAPIAALLAGL